MRRTVTATSASSRLREGGVAQGVPDTAQVGRVTLEDAAADLIHDYQTTRRRSLRVVHFRLTKP